MPHGAGGPTTDTNLDTLMSSLKELKDLIHEKYGLDPATLDAQSSIRDKGLDSLALVELLFAVEDRFGITMPDSEANVETLGQLAALIDRLVAAKASSSPTPSA